MIVTARAMAVPMCAMAIQMPASTNQMMLPIIDPTPAVGLSTYVRPNGHTAKLAMRNDATPNGNVTMRMHMMSPASM